MKISDFVVSIALFSVLFISSCNDVNPTPKEGEAVTIKAEGVKFEMVYIEPGAFTMGATPEHEGIDTFTELPVHRVTLSKGFFVGKTEVTQQLWKAIMGNNPSEQKNFNDKEDGKLPVTNITWAEAKQFVNKLSEKTGKKFRLPTEAEWEYVARGASKTYSLQFSGSMYLDQVACFRQNSSGVSHPVGQFRPNELGIYDMSGNVSEWVEDNFVNYKDSVQKDPCFQLSDTLSHVARGGSFVSKMNQCRTASREYYEPGEKAATIGLRVVMDE